jgi:DNA-directed RNA polymerase subunit K/omega
MSNLSDKSLKSEEKSPQDEVDDVDDDEEDLDDVADDDDDEENDQTEDSDVDDDDEDDAEEDSIVDKESNPGDLSTSNVEDLSPINSDVDSDDDNYLQKFDVEENNKYINKYHPECLVGNSIEVENLAKVTRDKNNNIIDDNHRTQPFLTKYERTKLLGQRASQINAGAQPYVVVPKNIIDGYLIAQLELTAKKIPVIIRRPLPNNKSEYWKLEDLEQL